MKCQYYKDYRNKKILIAAPLPLPYGGISVHAKRLQRELESNGNQVVVYQAHLYSNWLERIAFLANVMLHHRPQLLISHTSYHGIFESILFIFLRMILFERWVLVDHDCRYLDNRSRFFRFIQRYACHWADNVVLMGNAVKALYDKHAIYPKNTIIDCPYISPAHDELNVKESLPLLDAFVEKHFPVVLINGSCFMKTSEGKDMYGFDTALELLHVLKSDYPKIGLIIMVGKNNDQSYLESLKFKCVRLNLEDNILWLIGNYYLPSIVIKTSLMIRPTISENFGLSVAEAIDLGVHVVASDCCKRYPGAFIYPTHEKHNFEQLVRCVLVQRAPLNQDAN